MSDTAVRRLEAAIDATETLDYAVKLSSGQYAANLLAADPGLAEAIELGLAWAAAEKALPEGGWLQVYEDFYQHKGEYVAEAARPLGTAAIGRGSTPTLALLALKDKIGGKAE